MMRVWLILGAEGRDAAGLEGLLRRWAARSESAHWRVESRRLGPGLGAEVRAHRPEVLVLGEECGPGGPWVDELPTLDAGLVAVTTPADAAPYLALAEQRPVQPVPLPLTEEGLGLAVLAALASLRRERSWKAQLQQLQQRLEDRIIIERAKGVLVRRLGILEEEAYKRLRVLSRRERRPIRAIAQALLDAQVLLGPGAEGLPASSGEVCRTMEQLLPPA